MIALLFLFQCLPTLVAVSLFGPMIGVVGSGMASNFFCRGLFPGKGRPILAIVAAMSRSGLHKITVAGLHTLSQKVHGFAEVVDELHDGQNFGLV